MKNGRICDKYHITKTFQYLEKEKGNNLFHVAQWKGFDVAIICLTAKRGSTSVYPERSRRTHPDILLSHFTNHVSRLTLHEPRFTPHASRTTLHALILWRNHYMRTVGTCIHQPWHSGRLWLCGQSCAFASHIWFVDYVTYFAF